MEKYGRPTGWPPPRRGAAASVFNAAERNDPSFFQPPGDVNNICANFGAAEVICLRSQARNMRSFGVTVRDDEFSNARKPSVCARCNHSLGLLYAWRSNERCYNSHGIKSVASLVYSNVRSAPTVYDLNIRWWRDCGMIIRLLPSDVPKCKEILVVTQQYPFYSLITVSLI